MAPDLFDGVLATHHAEIYRYLRRVTARPAEADDLAQETFIRAYRAWAGLPAGANVRAWLFTIATNLARNHFRAETRRRRAHEAAADRPPASMADGPEETRVYQQTRELLETTLATLPDKQRLAFTLRKLHDVEYADIARCLGCSAESARAHVFQALKKIRRSLNDHALTATEISS